MPEPERVELAVNTERRRGGEVALGVLGSKVDGFCWVSVAEARDFAWNILRAIRDAEEAAA